MRPGKDGVAKAVPKWVKDSRDLRIKIHMPLNWHPWTIELKKELRGLPDSDRYRELLNLNWFSR